MTQSKMNCELELGVVSAMAACRAPRRPFSKQAAWCRQRESSCPISQQIGICDRGPRAYAALCVLLLLEMAAEGLDVDRDEADDGQFRCGRGLCGRAVVQTVRGTGAAAGRVLCTAIARNGREGRTVDDQAALAKAKDVLRSTFSLILLTERLGDFGPLVQKTLGWTASDFDAFRAKKNPAPDTRLLEAWRPDWSEEIGRRMPLDRGFYAYAAELAEARMKG